MCEYVAFFRVLLQNPMPINNNNNNLEALPSMRQARMPRLSRLAPFATCQLWLPEVRKWQPYSFDADELFVDRS